MRARVGARLLLRTAALRVVLLQELVKADEGLLQLEVLEAQPVLASLEHLAVTGFGRQVGLHGERTREKATRVGVLGARVSENTRSMLMNGSPDLLFACELFLLRLEGFLHSEARCQLAENWQRSGGIISRGIRAHLNLEHLPALLEQPRCRRDIVEV